MSLQTFISDFHLQEVLVSWKMFKKHTLYMSFFQKMSWLKSPEPAVGDTSPSGDVCLQPIHPVRLEITSVWQEERDTH